MLILAQVLKQDVPPYKNMPATAEEQRIYALSRFQTLVSPHFRWEEEVLLPLAENYGDKLIQLAKKVREEHQSLRQGFTDLVNAPEADLAQQMDLLGRQLAAHIRFEERIFFQKMQDILPDAAWISVEEPGRWN